MDSFYNEIVKKLDNGLDVRLELSDECVELDCLEPEDAVKIEEDLYNGNIICFTAKVSIESNGIEIGSDYLGQCLYESPEDFIENGDTIDDMIAEALEDAKVNLLKLQGIKI